MPVLVLLYEQKGSKAALRPNDSCFNKALSGLCRCPEVTLTLRSLWNARCYHVRIADGLDLVHVVQLDPRVEHAVQGVQKRDNLKMMPTDVLTYIMNILPSKLHEKSEAK